MTTRASLKSIVSAAALTVAAVTLAGCANRHDIEVGAIPDDYRTRHPIVVTEAERDLEILVSSAETRLTGSDRTRIDEFGTRFRASRAAVVRVQVPSGGRNDRAAGLVAQDVVRALGRRGVARNRILLSPYPASAYGEAAPIRLSFNAVVAEVAPCGRWPDDLGDTSENKNYFNFGCASQQNLAAQISDPRDLLGPRGQSEIDAERRTTVIDNYRRGDATAGARTITESNYDW